MPRFRKGSLVSYLARTLDIPYDQAQGLVAATVPVLGFTPVDPDDWTVFGQRLGWGGHKALANAGFRSAVGVMNKSLARNPSMMVVTEMLVASEVGTGIMNLRQSSGTTLAGTQQAFARDLTTQPISSNQLPVGQIIFDNTQGAAAYGGGLVSDGLTILAAGAMMPLLSPAVLGPQHNIFFMHAVDNAGVAAHFAWREYELQISVA